MNFKSAAKVVLALIYITGFTQLAPGLTVISVPPIILAPAPHSDVYLVYTGTVNATHFSSTSGFVTQTNTVYLVMDLANSSNYSVLVVGPGKNAWYHIGTRVLSSDGTSVATYDQGIASTSDPTENFLASLTHTSSISTTTASISTPVAGQATEGQAVWKYTVAGTQSVTANATSHTYPDIFDTYATGPLEGLTSSPHIVFPTESVVPVTATAKAAAKAAAKVAANAVSTFYSVNLILGPYTNLIGSDQNDAHVVPYFSSLSGTSEGYAFDATLLANPIQGFQPLTRATTSGTVSLSLNSMLSGIANVGGSYEVPTPGPVKLPLSMVIQPISGPLTSSGSPTVYEDFLYHIAQSLGLAGNGGYVPSP